MSSRHSQRRRSAVMAMGLHAILLASGVIGLPIVYAAEPDANEHHAHEGSCYSHVSMPGWTQTLKGKR